MTISYLQNSHSPHPLFCSVRRHLHTRMVWILKIKVCYMRDLMWVILVRNNAGATPRHGIRPESGGDKILYILHSVGASRCPPDMQGCTRGCTGSSDDYNGVPPPVPSSSESREIVTQMLSFVGMDVATTR